MRYLLTVMLTLCVVGLASADAYTLGNMAPDKGTYIGDGAFDGREGGENFGDAVPIACGDTDTGATCDNIGDVGYSGCGFWNTAPDVVYSFTADAAGFVTASLCGSGYDTVIAIYDAGYTEIACNDDFCGLQSEVEFAAAAGATYYIVVSGYYDDCGSYTLTVTCGGGDLCDTTCPDGAQLEGEPVCYDEYYDATNGGCNSEGWTLVCPQVGDEAVLCGESGTFYVAGGAYRDTDWMRAYGNGGTATATCCASFPLQLIFIYGTDCNFLEYDLITANPFEEVSLSRTVADGTEFWVWVGPTLFGDGVPCGSDWLLTLTGISAGVDCEPTAVEETTIGQIKSLYR